MAQILNMEFRTLGSNPEIITIGGSTSDHLPMGRWIDSRDEPMNQNGCPIAVGDTRALSDLDQIELWDTLCVKLGYDSHVALWHGVNGPFYLNGMQEDENHNPMPYLMFTSSGPAVPHTLHYFTGAGVDLGRVYENIYGGGEDRNFAVAILGQLYTDGTYKGQQVTIAPKTIGDPFNNQYYYRVQSDYYEEDSPQYGPINEDVLNDLVGYIPIPPEGGGNGGGEGDFNADSDAISVPGLPSANPLATGMCAMYKMDAAQLQALSTYLWSTNFEDVIKKLFNDPMESILNLSIVPLDLLSTAAAGVKIGNVITSVSGYPVSYPYKQINFGTINLKEFWGTFADYSPYTKLSIFLPYVGTQTLSIDDVMNGSVQLIANCDGLTGSVTYILYSAQQNWAGHGHNSVLYSWGGNMQYQVPLTASNYSQVVSSLIGTAGTIAGGVATSVATGGISAPMAIGVAGSAISNVMNAKTHVQRGGGLGGSMGLFGVQTPYLILERPEELYSRQYNHTVGIPNESTSVLTYFSGFVKVKGVHIEINRATQDEIDEIESILKEGVLV